MSKYFKIPLIIIVTVLALQLIDFDRVDAQYRGIYDTNQRSTDEPLHINILEALKRMNVRLVRIEFKEIKFHEAGQDSLLNQMMSLRTSQEQIQATGEMNTAEMLASANGVKTVVLDLENHLNDQVKLAFDKKKQEEKNFKDRYLPLLGQIEKQLRDQKIILANTHDFFKADLIPTLKNENEKMRQIIVAEIAKLRG